MVYFFLPVYINCIHISEIYSSSCLGRNAWQQHTIDVFVEKNNTLKFLARFLYIEVVKNTYHVYGL